MRDIQQLRAGLPAVRPPRLPPGRPLNWKPDRRPGRTREALLKALEELLGEEGLHGLSLKKLTDRANVNRVTFYHHFRSLRDFTTATVCQKVEALEACMRPRPSAALIQHIQAHAALYKTALCGAVISPFHPRILNSLMQSLRPRTGLSASATAGAAIGLLAWWLTSGMAEAPQQLADKLDALLDSLDKFGQCSTTVPGLESMEIDVSEAARLLSVSEKTIYRWIKRGEIPGFRISGQYRFSRTELLEWATARRIGVRPEIFSEPAEDGADPGVADCLAAGGIHYRVPGATKSDVLAAVIKLMNLSPDVDREFLLGVLLSRESLGSTGIGEGIAIPHVRNPIVLHGPMPAMTLCFLETPVDFDSIDGKPVHTLFTLVSPTVKAHLRILSRLTHALRQDAFRSAVDAQADRESLIAAARTADAGVRPLP